ncbi:hypothetical protein [Krasilnikovia sp. MM14-A1259]|uniref:hypothetical protein n=1 Tax=Krasilnikovia sp. MM14-A1259 TaxID=3373539 RepID=UPI0037F68B6D
MYDNPKAMAEAYQATPAYPGLTKAQVAAFQQKLTSDTAFAKQLSANLAQTCKPGSRPGRFHSPPGRSAGRHPSPPGRSLFRQPAAALR